jgi:transposase-like protein
MNKRIINKDAIVSEYLTGNLSYRQLGAKYGINYKNIHRWVRRVHGKKPRVVSKPIEHLEQQIDKPMSADVYQLQQELRKAQLNNKLLNAMIDIAEEQLGVEIRKKSGTRQSRK